MYLGQISQPLFTQVTMKALIIYKEKRKSDICMIDVKYILNLKSSIETMWIVYSIDPDGMHFW